MNSPFDNASRIVSVTGLERRNSFFTLPSGRGALLLIDMISISQILCGMSS